MTLKEVEIPNMISLNTLSPTAKEKFNLYNSCPPPSEPIFDDFDSLIKSYTAFSTTTMPLDVQTKMMSLVEGIEKSGHIYRFSGTGKDQLAKEIFNTVKKRKKTFVPFKAWCMPEAVNNLVFEKTDYDSMAITGWAFNKLSKLTGRRPASNIREKVEAVERDTSLESYEREMQIARIRAGDDDDKSDKPDFDELRLHKNRSIRSIAATLLLGESYVEPVSFVIIYSADGAKTVEQINNNKEEDMKLTTKYLLVQIALCELLGIKIYNIGLEEDLAELTEKFKG